MSDLDPQAAATLVKSVESSGGNYNVGYGGADLSGAPKDQYGFPIWSGKVGPAGVSHAAGAYQFQPGTWAKYAAPLGITDFSPESQDKVFKAAYAAEGMRPWQPYWGGAGKGFKTGLHQTQPDSMGAGDLTDTLVNTAPPQNTLAPKDMVDAILSRLPPASAPQQPATNPIALMALMAAGTHKITPINYDPFKGAYTPPMTQSQAPTDLPATPRLTPLPMVANDITPTYTPRPTYTTKVGMRQAYQQYNQGLPSGG
jgi:hypothetical protein